MPETKGNPLVSALDGLKPVSNNKVEQLFGDSPEVLEAIKRARKRKVGNGTIAKQLNSALPADAVESIGESSVKTWLRNNGVD